MVLIRDCAQGDEILALRWAEVIDPSGRRRERAGSRGAEDRVNMPGTEAKARKVAMKAPLRVLRLPVPASGLNRDTQAILVLGQFITCKDYIFFHPSRDKT